jgi:hypothetical protein
VSPRQHRLDAASEEQSSDFSAKHCSAAGIFQLQDLLI